MPQSKRAGHAVLSPDRARALAASLRATRSAAGMTQERLAQSCGISVQHVQRIEGAAANPTLATLYRITDALQVHLSDLLAPQNGSGPA